MDGESDSVSEHLPYLAGLGVVAVAEEHKDIVRYEPLGSPSQGRQPLCPDVPADGFFAYLEISRRLGYGELLGHGHGGVL